MFLAVEVVEEFEEEDVDVVVVFVELWFCLRPALTGLNADELNTMVSFG